MAASIAFEESSYLVFRLFNNGVRAVDSIKDYTFQIFNSVFFSNVPYHFAHNLRTHGNDQSMLRAIEDFIGCVGNHCQATSVEQFFPKRCSDENGDPGGAFNVLDAMLKNSLERLEMMRATVTWETLGSRKLFLVTEYSRHVAIIRNLCLGGKVEAALHIRNYMMKKGMVPDVFTHNFLVNGFCKSGDMERANRLVQEMMKTGPSPNCATYNTLITGYCLVNKLNEAIGILHTMTNKCIRQNRVTCNILIHAFCKEGHVGKAWTVSRKLLSDVEKDSTDLITSTILVDDCFKVGDTFQALYLWGNLFRNCNQIDAVAYNVLINGFSLNRLMNLAYGCLFAMLKRGVVPDIFTFNSLINYLCREGKLDKVCYLLSVMSTMGVDPDHISYKIIIQGLCMHGDMPNANKYFRLMLENSIVPELLVWNVIIHGHGRSGDLLSALSVRDEMMRFDIQPNIFTYNALIYAAVKGGEIMEAFNLKEKMHQSGVIPDVVTYNLLICAACRIGVIHVAVKLLNEMSHPDVISYTELIRYYCQRGSRKEVEKLMSELRRSGLNPDPVLKKIVKRSALGEKLKGLLESFQNG